MQKDVYLAFSIGLVALNALAWFGSLAFKYGVVASDIRGVDKATGKDPQGMRFIKNFSINIGAVTHFALLCLGVLSIVSFGAYENKFTSHEEYVDIPLWIGVLFALVTLVVRQVVFYMQAGYVGQTRIVDVREDMLWTSFIGLFAGVIASFIVWTEVSNAIIVLFIFSAVLTSYCIIHTARLSSLRMKNFAVWMPLLGLIIYFFVVYVFLLVYHPHYNLLFNHAPWTALAVLSVVPAVVHIVQTLFDQFVPRKHISGENLRSLYGVKSQPTKTTKGRAYYQSRDSKTLFTRVSESFFQDFD